jgi:hypothetical protein
MDTTAKVDIRKLQLLNDRIAQTIDALNQVRLSVHGLGLSHSSGVAGLGFGGVAGQSIPFQSAIAGFPQQAFGAWPGVVPGISHSSPYAAYASSPYASSPYAYSQHAYAQSPVSALSQVNPLLSQILWQQGLAGGLSHSSDPWSVGAVGYPQALAYHQGAQLDPYTASRIMHMFPFAQMPLSPVQ